MSPAEIDKIETDEESNTASVMVHDDQLSLAIGKSGQNARLAAKLSGWKIDIISPNSENTTDKKNEEVEDTKEVAEEEIKEEKVAAKPAEEKKEEEEKEKKEKPKKKATKTKTKK